MMKLPALTVLLTLLMAPSLLAVNTAVSTLCKNINYSCYKTTKGQTWEQLFPDKETRYLVKKLNRINLQLRAGMTIAVPKHLDTVSLNDISPMPHQITPPGEKTVIVDQSKLVFGAYEPNGELVYWGPISAGKGYCPDTHHGCKTVTGVFTIYNKGGEHCKSHEFPVGKGGAPMPYCMFFKGGFALHGSSTVPGYNASHGCVRLFKEDARWLNQEFIDVHHTKVIVYPPI